MTDIRSLIDARSAILPTTALTTEDILYGSRTTEYRFEVLTHDPATGRDTLAGVLDGVSAASVQWSANATVKGSGTMTVADLAAAGPGMLRAGDIDMVTARIRPVLLIEGLPEIPLSTFIITAAPEQWTDTGRTYALELHDIASVLATDQIEVTFTADATTPILKVVAAVIASAGESIDVDATVTATLSSPLVWAAGTSKLTIIADLLDALGYAGLYVDGLGAFRAEPYIRPADRPTSYDVLGGLSRDLIDGETSIYLPDWSRDRDAYGVPNKVIAVESSSGDEEPLTGVATNTNPDSPFSYARRGRWITSTLTGVEVADGTTAQKTAALVSRAQQALTAASAVQAAVQIEHLPIPLRVSEVVRFRSTPAGIDGRHVVTSLSLDCTPTGLCKTTLQEVINV